MNLQNPQIQTASASVIKQERVGQLIEEKPGLAPLSGMKDFLPKIIYYGLKKKFANNFTFEAFDFFIKHSKFFNNEKLEFDGKGFTHNQNLFIAAIALLGSEKLQKQVIAKFCFPVEVQNALDCHWFVSKHLDLEDDPCLLVREVFYRDSELKNLSEHYFYQVYTYADKSHFFQSLAYERMRAAIEFVRPGDKDDETCDQNVQLLKSLVLHSLSVFHKALDAYVFFDAYFEAKKDELCAAKTIDFDNIFQSNKQDLYEYFLKQLCKQSAEYTVSLSEFLRNYSDTGGAPKEYPSARHIRPFRSASGASLRKDLKRFFFNFFGCPTLACDYAYHFNFLMTVVEHPYVDYFKAFDLLEKKEYGELKEHYYNSFFRAKIGNFFDFLPLLLAKQQGDLRNKIDTFCVKRMGHLCTFQNCKGCAIKRLFFRYEEAAQKYMRYKEVEWVSTWKFLQPFGSFLHKWVPLIHCANLLFIYFNVENSKSETKFFFLIIFQVLVSSFYLSQSEKIERSLNIFDNACIEFDRYKDDKDVGELLEAEKIWFKKCKKLAKLRSGTMYD